MFSGVDPSRIVHEGVETVIVKHTDSQDGGMRCYKALLDYNPSEVSQQRLIHEYEITQNLQGLGIRKVLDKTFFQHRFALLMEYVPGLSLKEWMHQQEHDTEDRLNVAMALARTLGDLHQQHVIHNALNPYNVVVNPANEMVYLIDFGVALLQTAKGNVVGNASEGNRHLHYISPEQTGRVNRKVDHRSDLYALGVILYELFARQTPFAELEDSELIHAHLARQPLAPRQQNPAISVALEQIILKLLSKNAQDRYHSALGVMADLQKVADLGEDERLETITLGEFDYSGRLYPIQHLYGRESEKHLLFERFRLVQDGNTELIWVSGPSGVGKSSLIEALAEHVGAQRALFALGKFQETRQPIPYTAIGEAINALVLDTLMPLPENTRDRILAEVQNQLGQNGRLLTDLIPALAVWMGPQPEVAKVKGKEEQFRLELAFQNLFRALASVRNPLVLHMDDLQWADPPSVHLLQSLIEDSSISYLMVIGSFRTHEVAQNAATVAWINQARKRGVGLSIRLGNLGFAGVHAMLQDVLHTRQDNLPELTSLMLSKTKGNPFFTYQLIRSLYEEGSLRYAVDLRRWVWDAVSVGQQALTGNLVDFMTDQISRLSPELTKILSMAAILGFRFQTRLLLASMDQTRQALKEPLNQLTRDGWLIQEGTEYRFAHDRFHQAALSQVREQDAPEFHYRLSEALLANLTPEEQDEQIFELVYHTNQGADYKGAVSRSEFRLRINLKAALKAQQTAAFEEALGYLKVCRHELPKDPWTADFDLTLEVYQALAETAFYAGALDEAESYLETLFAHSESLEHRLFAHELRMQLLIYQQQYAEALAWGLDLLRDLGVAVPTKMTPLAARRYLGKTHRMLGRFSEDQLMALPEAKQDLTRAITRIGFELSTPAYFQDQSYVAWLAYLLIKHMVEDGLTPSAIHGLSQYAYIMGVRLGRIDEGIAYSSLAVRIADARHFTEPLAQAIYIKNVFLAHNRITYPDTVLEMEKGLKSALEGGKYQMATMLVHSMINQTYYAGVPLPELIRYSEALDQQIRRFRVDNEVRRMQVYRQGFLNLQRLSDPPDSLAGNLLDEDTIQDLSEADNKLFQVNVYVNRLHLAIYYRLPEQAYGHAQDARSLIDLTKGALSYTHFEFHSALALAGHMRENGTTRLGMLQLRKQLRKLKKYARMGPVAFSQKAQFVAAEYYALRGKKRKAMDCYSQALKDAVRHNRLNDEALIWEWGAHFYHSIGDEIMGNFYFENAFRIFRRWGATGKLDQLNAQNPDLFGKLRYRDAEKTNQTLDLASVLKASSSLASEIQLDKLLDTLMQILLENAGAGHGLFMLEIHGRWYIMASGDAESGITTNQRVPIVGSGRVPETVIETVKLMGKPVIIDDAQQNNPYGTDPFFTQHQTRSVLCMPVQAQGRLLGLVYLSNTLTSGIFTEQRLGLLEMLSRQIGISVDNAILYEELDRKVQQRTDELKATLEELQEKNLLVETRNQEVEASIQYGQIIQRAMLSNLNDLQPVFPDSFVYFRPRDVVSGDFYWWVETEEHMIVASVDCTGHGVPGAFMSMIGIQLLDSIVKIQGITQPDKILEHLQTGVYEALRHQEWVLQDGMDLGLCRVAKQGTQLDFAGAKSSLVYVDAAGVHRVRGERTSLSGDLRYTPQTFALHSIRLQPGTMVYLYSDGYQDQFGGLEDKKFQAKAFRTLLADIARLPASLQAQELDQTLQAWKGDRQQTDDILVLGFRVGKRSGE